MPSPEPNQLMPPNTRPGFTTLSRVLGVLALAATAAAMYWVINNDSLDGPKKLLAAGGVLTAGVLLIAAGAHFCDGKHRP
jgi:hypothetical protein